MLRDRGDSLKLGTASAQPHALDGCKALFRHYLSQGYGLNDMTCCYGRQQWQRSESNTREL